MTEEKLYFCEINLSIAVKNFGKTKKEFIQNVKDNFYEEHNIQLHDSEIENIQEQ